MSSQSNRPTISVVMPVYNGERFLAEAIRSVLSQTFTDFELIAIDDGSTDRTDEIIRSFNDPRIVYIKNQGNLGLAKSFNIGVNAARGEFIARMDADDICTPDRFNKQIAFLRRKPHLGVLGSSIILIDERGNRTGRHMRPTDHNGIKFSSLFSTPMFHPTVMGKAEIFKSYHYNESLTNSEDYELWSRLLFQTDTTFANIKRPLLYYRVFPQSFTKSLNLDKRAISAHNTVTNISHYTKLSDKERNIIVAIRQERKLPITSLFTNLLTYWRAARAFVQKEQVSLKGALAHIYPHIAHHAFFLLKYWIKRL